MVCKRVSPYIELNIMTDLCLCPNCGKSLKWRLLLTKYGSTEKKWYQFVKDTTAVPTKCCPCCEAHLEEPALLRNAYRTLLGIWLIYIFIMGNSSLISAEGKTWHRWISDISLIIIFVIIGWLARARIGYRIAENV